MIQSHTNSYNFTQSFSIRPTFSCHEILLLELLFFLSLSRIQETLTSANLFCKCFISYRYLPVGVHFQREAWCYWCLLFTTLYASRRRGNLIYFSTNVVSLNKTATNQVKGKVYICMKRKYINRIPCCCVGVEQSDRWAGDVSFYILSPNWVSASPPQVQYCAPSDRALLWLFCGGRTHPWMHRAGSETLFIINISLVYQRLCNFLWQKCADLEQQPMGFNIFYREQCHFRLSISSITHIVDISLSKDWSIKYS
jgi:hypothetical protein